MSYVLHPPHWFAFYTRPRHEKKVFDRLTEKGVEVFCPLIKTRVRWSDRWKKVYKPVLPGYIFAYVAESERHDILQDPSILNTVFWNKKPAIIRPEEIEAMKYVLLLTEAVGEDPPQPGHRVDIVNGSMAGNTGIVMRLSRNSVAIRIDSLEIDFLVQVPLQHIR
jgi:transcription antitermination factor NusG